MSRVQRKDAPPSDDDAAQTWSRRQLRAMDQAFSERVTKSVKAAPAPAPKPQQKYPHRNLRRLNGQQLRRVLESAQQIRQQKRDAFLLRCAVEIGEGPDAPGDGDVQRAIATALTALHDARVTTL